MYNMDQDTEHIWILMARKLSGEASPEELAELEALLIMNPQETYSFEIMQDIWKNKPAGNPQFSENSYKELLLRMQQMGIDPEKFSDEDHFIHRSEEPDQDQGNKRNKYILSGILFIAIIFTSILLFPGKRNQKEIAQVPLNNEVVTRNGAKTNLVLPDGTHVYLNSGSKIEYGKDYGILSREVNLTGEAYFDVVKNPAKPFVIHTAKINVKVLGTAFNVRCYPDEKNTETSLIRGSLEVSFKEGNEKIILKPNEKLVINNQTIKQNPSTTKKEINPTPKNVFELSHVGLLPQDNSIIETSWVYNRLVFNSEAFEDIAQKMEKWYGVNIGFDNEDLKSKKFTGVFENETIYEALDAIQMTTRFSYKEKDGQIILSK